MIYLIHLTVALPTISDCSGIQTKFGAVKEMQIHHNWIYSLPYHKGIRLDTGENGARIYENVIWNASKGATIKGGVIEGNEIIQVSVPMMYISIMDKTCLCD